MICIAVDGDTIRCRTDLSAQSQRVRLWGIDSVERGEPGFAKAKAAMRTLIRRKTVICKPPVGKARFRRDRYRRIVARCFVDGKDVAIWMVCNKQARDWPRYSGGYYTRVRCPK